jgi:RIO-like serine/threonine protein kinase
MVEIRKPIAYDPTVTRSSELYILNPSGSITKTKISATAANEEFNALVSLKQKLIMAGISSIRVPERFSVTGTRLTMEYCPGLTLDTLVDNLSDNVLLLLREFLKFKEDHNYVHGNLDLSHLIYNDADNTLTIISPRTPNNHYRDTSKQENAKFISRLPFKIE